MNNSMFTKIRLFFIYIMLLRLQNDQSTVEEVKNFVESAKKRKVNRVRPLTGEFRKTI